MKRSRTVFLMIVSLAVSGMMGIAMAQDEAAKPPHSIKEVMKKAHKDGLLKKVLNEEASQDEKLQLLDLYISMYESKPPKGDMESWHKMAGASAMAAAKVAAGRDALPELKKATACAGCHKAHKGE